jgi:hypothetical protein
MTTTPPVRRRAGTWRGLLLLAVAVDLVLLVAQGAARQDWEALAVAAALLIGALLLRFRGGLAGLVVLTLSFANLVLWMLPAAISNAAHRQGVVGLLLPASLAAVSLAGLVAGLASIARRHLDVPVGGERRITFSAEPGSYEFYRWVPGHRQAGMVGTLRVG